MMTKRISRILYWLFLLYQLMFCIVLVRIIFIHYFWGCCCNRLDDCKILKYLFFGSIIILVFAIIIDLINYRICKKIEESEKNEMEERFKALGGEIKEAKKVKCCFKFKKKEK